MLSALKRGGFRVLFFFRKLPSKIKSKPGAEYGDGVPKPSPIPLAWQLADVAAKAETCNGNNIKT